MPKAAVIGMALFLIPVALSAQTPARHATKVRGEVVAADNQPVTPATRAVPATHATPATHNPDGTTTRATPATPATPAVPASPSHRPDHAGQGGQGRGNNPRRP